MAMRKQKCTDEYAKASTANGHKYTSPYIAATDAGRHSFLSRQPAQPHDIAQLLHHIDPFRLR